MTLNCGDGGVGVGGSGVGGREGGRGCEKFGFGKRKALL